MVRLNLELNDETIAIINKLAKEHGIGLRKVIRLMLSNPNNTINNSEGENIDGDIK